MNIDPEVTEEAARAIYANMNPAGDWEDEAWWCLNLARAALEAAAESIASQAWDEGRISADDDWKRIGYARNPYMETK